MKDEVVLRNLAATGLAAIIAIAMVIWLPLLFIGLFCGWFMSEKKDKIKEFGKSLEKSLEKGKEDEH